MASTSTPGLAHPMLVYDGDCSFCKYWVSRWRLKTGGKVRYTPFQELPEEFRGTKHAQFRKSVYLFTKYGQRLHGAEAVAALLHLSGHSTWNWLYHSLPLAGKVAETGYRLVADNRDFFFKLTKLIFKDDSR